MTKKTIAELEEQLAKAKKDQATKEKAEKLINNKKNKNVVEIKQTKSDEEDVHTVILMDAAGETFEKELEQKSDFTASEKAKILANVSEFEQIEPALQKVIAKGTSGRVIDWIEVIVVLDEVSNTILKIVYDVEDPTQTVPSLPNMDILGIFFEENSDWISEKTRNLFNQVKYLEKSNQ